MDTRKKIVSPEAALAAARERRSAGERIALVTGYFDPLLASHARCLREGASPGLAVFVAIADPPQPVLPARARAELVAALADVDYVILPEGAAALGGLAPDELHDQRAADERRTGELMRHVHSRQKP